MNWILEPIGYLYLGDCEKCFLGAWDKRTVIDVLLKKKTKTWITAELHPNLAALD